MIEPNNVSRIKPVDQLGTGCGEQLLECGGASLPCLKLLYDLRNACYSSAFMNSSTVYQKHILFPGTDAI